MIKDQERHARHKGDDKLGKCAAKKKKDAMIRRSLMLRKLLILFTFKRSQVNHLHQPLLCIFVQIISSSEPFKS